MVSFALVGALGRMGQAIARLSLADDELSLEGTFEHPSHEAMGKSYTELTGLKEISSNIESISAEAISSLSGVIDFSSPESSLATSALCIEKRVPLVIGTTGWTPEQKKEITTASKQIPILLASNMSLGVNLLFALTRAAARTLQDAEFDPEIVETHHKLKKDAPSGTATTLKEAILEEFNWSESEVTYGREGMVGERPEKQLGVMTLRGGDVVGEHTVNFFGEGEKITLNHQATSRDTFARGALYALKYLQGKGMGLYNMQDALNLHL